MTTSKTSSADLSRLLAQRLAARLLSGAVQYHQYANDKQQAFIYANEHHLAFIGGIGSGKSIGGAMRGVRAAMGWIGNKQVQIPNLGVVTAPTYTMLEDATIRAFQDVCIEHVPGFNLDKHYKQYHLTLPNGSEILFRSTQNPERLRGPSITWWMGDEAALSPAKSRLLMLGRLRQFGELGYEWVTTTPKGRNWVWQSFVRDAGEGYQWWRVRTDDNSTLTDELKDTWKQTYKGDFARQELDGEFVAFEGLIYGEFGHDSHVVQSHPDGFARVVAGVDWGYANPGVILVFGVDGDGRMWLVDERVKTQQRVETWVDVAQQLRDMWRIERFVCDPSEPDYIRQFTEAGLKAEPADNRVLPGIQRVQNRLVQVDKRDLPRLVVHSRCPHTLSEFDQYQWAENVHGIKDAPVKANDHTMDAMRYAVMAVDEQRKPIRASSQRYA
ncbi:MAG: terminase family protein [Chloroflexota bacterium]